MLALSVALGACSNSTSLRLPSILTGGGPAIPAASQPPPPPPPPVAPPEPPPPIVQASPVPPPPAVTPPAAPQPAAAGPVTAALLLPLSGPAAATGQALFQAAQLALFEIAGDGFTVLPYDTKSTPEGAMDAIKQAVAGSPAIILGPLFSADTKAVAPVARQAGIPMITFSVDASVLGGNVYSVGFLPGPQAVRIAAYARSQARGRVAILAPDSDYGRTVAEALLNDPSPAGAQSPQIQYYATSGGDASRPVQALLRAGPKTQPDDLGFDALLLPDEGQRLRGLAASLPLFGIDPAKIKLLGTMLWADSKPGAEPALVGGWYPAPPIAQHALFDRRFAKAFGAPPPRIASLGYDAVALAAVLAKSNPANFGQAALTNSGGFAGVDGLFRLKPNGTGERGYAIYEVQASGPDKEIAPAPTSFAAPSN